MTEDDQRCLGRPKKFGVNVFYSRRLCMTRFVLKARELKILQELLLATSNETRVQYEDAGDQNCLKFNLPVIVVAS